MVLSTLKGVQKMTKQEKQLIAKRWLKTLFIIDRNNTIIENYNNLYDTNLKDTRQDLDIVLNDVNFLDTLTQDEEQVQEMIQDLKDWQ